MTARRQRTALGGRQMGRLSELVGLLALPVVHWAECLLPVTSQAIASTFVIAESAPASHPSSWQRWHEQYGVAAG